MEWLELRREREVSEGGGREKESQHTPRIPRSATEAQLVNTLPRLRLLRDPSTDFTHTAVSACPVPPHCESLFDERLSGGILYSTIPGFGDYMNDDQREQQYGVTRLRLRIVPCRE